MKSLRAGRANISEAYARPVEREIFLVNAHIGEYEQAGPAGHEARRPRKLLLQRRQIDRLLGAVQREGATMVPLRLYFNERGIAKLELGLARGNASTTSARPRRSATGSASRRGSCAERNSVAGDGPARRAG